MRGLLNVTLIAGLLLCTTPVAAQILPEKDWFWSIDTEEFYYAGTFNAAGHVLGQYCYFSSGFCYYLIGIGISCKEGSQYPALINSDAGSGQITLIWSHKFQNQHVLAISSFEEIDRVVRNATRIGIAVALEDDQFKVSRFSLAGAGNAIDYMRYAAEKKMKRKPENRSRPAEEHL